MSYTITTTSGTTLATVADGTINTTSSSLTLIGKNYAGYGVFLNENYVKLLENFSSGTAPSNAIRGQLWFDSTNSVLKVYDGTQWKPISSSAAGASPPTGAVIGDLWWDTVNAQLKVWSGSTWVTIGPLSTAGTGTSGPVVETIIDNNPTPGSHIVTKFYLSNSVIGILSKDATFTPAASIPGFLTVKPGFQLVANTAISGIQFTGDASNSLTLQGLTASQFLRKDQAEVTGFTFKVQNNTGFYVGASDNLNINYASSSVNLIGTTNNADFNIYVNQGGVSNPAITVTGSSRAVSIPGNLTVSSNQTVSGNLNATAGFVNMGRATVSQSIVPTGNVSGINLGSTTARFSSVFASSFVGTSVQAQYADLAERFAADAVYEPGTVVEIGGIKEITAVVQDLSDKVFGVISTAAAYLMNAGAGTDKTHPPVAVNGRVPVRVIGKVRKGDRLVSAGNGLARAANTGEYTAFNVIGRALADKTTDQEGLVECIVKLNS